MLKLLERFGLILFVLAALGIFVPCAQASNVDFNCTPSNCTGTVTQSGPNFSSAGISLFNNTGTYSSSVAFTLKFDTSTKAISLLGTGALTGQDLIGTISSFTPFSGGVGLSVSWTTLPGAVSSQLGTSAGVGTTSVIFLTGGAAASVDLLIMPTPEPSGLLLLGSGLLAAGSFLRRRWLR